MKEIRIGVISFEHMHALSYTTELGKIEGVQLAGIADSDEYRGTKMASRFGTKYYNDYHDLLTEGLDGVIICTNNSMHCQVSCDALDSGCHVLVEKPFAICKEDAEKMLNHAKANGKRIMNAFPMRFNPNVIEAKKAVDEGRIGTILSITGINHGKIPSGWFIDKKLSGGGGVMDHTVHLADLIRWFTGSEFSSVYCESGDLLHNRNIDDTGLVMAHMENGAFVTIDCSWAHHRNYPIWPQVDMEIIGTKGTIELKAFAQVNHVTDQKNSIIEDLCWNEDGDAGLIREFADVIRTGREPNASGLDGARALEVAEAAYRSSKSHRQEQVIHVEA